MIRILLPPEELASEHVIITGDQARHLALVLRAQAGDTITVLDGNGHKYECRIRSVHKKEVLAQITGKAPYSTESPLSITLAQGIAKGEKMDLIIQKSTELGVSKITPLFTERSQVHHTHKVERWRKIALSAAEQSGRDRIPEIDEPADFREFLKHLSLKNIPDESNSHQGLICSEGHSKRNLKSVLQKLNGMKQITLLIGPEGGFSGEEVHAAIEKGFTELSLGPRILRTETAPIAILSILQYELGDIG